MAVLAVVQAVAWAPVLMRFWSSWRERHNPISLAICSLVVLAGYLGALAYWLCVGVGGRTLGLVVSGLNMTACVHAHASFVWAKKRFPDSRR